MYIPLNPFINKYWLPSFEIAVIAIVIGKQIDILLFGVERVKIGGKGCVGASKYEG